MGTALEQLCIEPLPLVQNQVEPVAFHDSRARIQADGMPLFGGHLHHAKHGRPQRLRIDRKREESSCGIRENFTRSRNVRGDAGQATRTSFEQAHGKPLAERGENERVGSLHESSNIASKAEKPHAACDSETAGKRAQSLFLRPASRNREACFSRKLRKSAKQRNVVLYRLEAAGGQPEKAFGEANFGSDSRAGRVERAPLVRVDA